MCSPTDSTSSKAMCGKLRYEIKVLDGNMHFSGFCATNVFNYKSIKGSLVSFNKKLFCV